MTAPHVPAVRAFLTELAGTNTKAWWEAHKARYETDLKAPALDLLDALAPRLAAAGFGPVTTKLFRPHRDVRFAADKTPYHTHLHLLWSLGTGPNAPGLFYGISPDYVTLGAGVMGFDKDGLTAWRAAVDADRGGIRGLVAGLLAEGGTMRAPDLKRVPAPYAQDHPAGDLLRYKGVSVWRDLGEGTGEADLWAAARPLLPLARWIADHI